MNAEVICAQNNNNNKIKLKKKRNTNQRPLGRPFRISFAETRQMLAFSVTATVLLQQKNETKKIYKKIIKKTTKANSSQQTQIRFNFDIMFSSPSFFLFT